MTVAGSGGLDLGDGGLAKEAGLCGPNDVVVDDAGNIYISTGGSTATAPVVTECERWTQMG